MDNPNTAVAVVASATGALSRLQEAVAGGIEPALAIMLDETLFGQVQRIAEVMSKARGFVPAHCVDAPEVCFAVVSRSLVWRLDPFAVAQATYQPTAGAKVAYEAKLVQAILEQSGRLDGAPKRRYHGDWSKVQGRFSLKTSEKSGKQYAVRAWQDADEVGLSITVTARVKGESEDRDPVELDLRQCHPRNSTLWATDPKTQIYYRAIRMLGNTVLPGVLMGVPFRGEIEDDYTPRGRAGRAREINPQQRARDEARAGQAPEEGVDLTDAHGEVRVVPAGEVELTVAAWVKEANNDELEALIENNPDMAYMIELADMEREGRRAEAEAARQDDQDPLKLENVKGAIGFLSALRVGIENAIIADADRYWTIYKEKAKRADEKVNAGDYASLEALVTAKIEGRP